MPVPAWRETVPHIPFAESWGIDKPWNAAAATEYEEGPSRQRKRSGPATVPWGREFTAAQFAEFEDMIREDFEQGTSRFTMTVRRPGRTDATKHCEIVGGAYQARANGVNTAVSMTLKIYDYYA